MSTPSDRPEQEELKVINDKKYTESSKTDSKDSKRRYEMECVDTHV